MRRKNRYNRTLYNAYDLDLKKSVILFAEQNGNKEAQARFGICEANIRRWRRLKSDIFGKPPDYKVRGRGRVNYRLKIEKVEVGEEGGSSVGESTDHNSMPLQERLSKVAAQEKIASGGQQQQQQQQLKSQPLSPTKLKVTRQGPKVTKVIEAPPSPVNEEMCLRWNSHHSNMQTAFPNILSKEQYVDVTLAAEGKTLKCHRLILSSCSPYFDEILSGISPFQHPVLFMKDIPFWILKSLCDFMYAGEVHIFQNKLEELLTVAEALKIKGLAGKSTPPENQEDQSGKPTNNSHHNNNKENKKKQYQHVEKPKHYYQPPMKKHPVFTQSNNFESTSHDDDDLLDPLELLEPLYEEVAEEKKPSTIVKPPKEIKYNYQPVKKPFQKRLRKRKFSEQREPSPPPVFSFRKGTRSRPNVKIPKYYHSDYSNPQKTPQNSQTDPLLEVDEIKTEPIDVEDNLIDYSDEDHYMENSLEPANCPPPLIITSKLPSTQSEKFKKIKLSKPIITEVHTIETIEENNPTAGGLEVIKITMQQSEDGEKKEGDPLQNVVIEGVESEAPDPEPQISEPQSQEASVGEEVPPQPQEVAMEAEELCPQNEIEAPTDEALPPQEEESEVRDEETVQEETGLDVVANKEESEKVPEIQIEDVRSEACEEIDGESEEERTNALGHLEKEAMNVANAINQENEENNCK